MEKVGVFFFCLSWLMCFYLPWIQILPTRIGPLGLKSVNFHSCCRRCGRVNMTKYAGSHIGSTYRWYIRYIIVGLPTFPVKKQLKAGKYYTIHGSIMFPRAARNDTFRVFSATVLVKLIQVNVKIRQMMCLHGFL